MPVVLPSPHIYPPYQYRDSINCGVQTGLIGLSAGLFSACVKNAFFSSSASAWTTFSVYGSTIPIYGGMFGAYGFTKSVMSNFRRTNDGWNEFAGGFSGGFLWGVFRRQSLANCIAVSTLAGTVLGIYSWAGGLGGFSQFAGVDFQKQLQHRREFRFFPSNLIPSETYEWALGRRTTPLDFNDINEIMGTERTPIETDVVGIHPIHPETGKPWWQEVIDKAKAEAENEKK